MKTQFILTCCLLTMLALPLTGSAQPDRKGPPPSEKEREDKVEKLKIAFITKELELTTEETEKFWPVYNELENKLKEIRKANRKIEKEIAESYDKMTEEEAKKKFDEVLANEEKELNLRKEYQEKFSKMIGNKRTLKLLSLEREFKRELLEALREQGPPPPPPPHGRPHGR